ncbi:MAG: flagellin [Firmicutes bacterium]|nr:flagellin [Bacillota bacterium]
MRINHNMAALNTYSKLSQANSASAKSLEKLSSGLRINRAGDDAAGLAISEKMRAQVRGLDQASSNAQNGISLIQTGEGALNETHSILQRMRELAVQSATDTNTADDRTKIQSEVDQLAKEITRISNTTEFNTKNLLAGGLSTTFHVGANADQNMSLSVSAMDAQSLGVAGSLVSTTFSGTDTGLTSISTSSESLNGLYASVTSTAATGGGVAATASNASGGAGTISASTGYTGSTSKTFIVKIGAVDGSGAVTAASYSTDGGSTFNSAAVAAGTVTLSDGMTLAIATDADNAANDTYSFTMTPKSLSFKLTSADNGGGTAYGTTQTVYNNQSSVVLGDAATGKTLTANFTFDTAYAAIATPGTYEGDQITQTVTASTAAVTGADGSVSADAVTQKGINVSDQASANNAITTIDNAIKTVSTERAKLGAMQNRLEHTISNLGTSSENLTAAESRVRDVDMAKEMMEFQKNNILNQAATAMLAQANQQPQGVLQLLR